MCPGAISKRISPLLALILLAILSCAPPASIATFAGDADKAITAGEPVFGDIHDSCVRRRADEGRLVPQYPHIGQTSPDATGASTCASFVPEVQELESIASVLSAYFRSMQQLAAFDQANASAPAEHAGQNVGTAAILTVSQTDSIAKLTGLITRAVTGHYQRNKLMEFLQAADPHVAAISQALETVLVKDYRSLLDEEERAIKRRYQEVSGAKETATILLLNRAYADDLNALKRRRAAATAYITVLKEAREANHLLANSPGHFDKETSLALQPYILRLQDLTTSIQTQL
jgi:hypothetical protein